MNKLELKSIIKLDNSSQLFNLQDCLKYITGATNGNDVWAKHKMQELKGLQRKLCQIKEKKDGSYSFRITPFEAETLIYPLREERVSIYRLFNEDVIKSFDKLFKNR